MSKNHNTDTYLCTHSIVLLALKIEIQYEVFKKDKGSNRLKQKWISEVTRSKAVKGTVLINWGTIFLSNS